MSEEKCEEKCAIRPPEEEQYFLSRLVVTHFNQILVKFLEEYCLAFQDLQGPKGLLRLAKKLAADESLPIKKYSKIMKLFMDSFIPVKEALDTKNPEKFFKECVMNPGCKFCQHIELSYVWEQCKTDERESLIGSMCCLYLCMETTLVLPKNALESIENKAAEEDVDSEKRISTLEEVSTKVVEELSDESVSKMTEFAIRFVSSPHSPVYEVAPEKYHSYFAGFSKTVASAEGRKLISDAITPLSTALNSKMSEHLPEGGLDLGGEEGSAVSIEEIESKSPEAKGKMVKQVVALFKSMLNANKDKVESAVNDPIGMLEMITNSDMMSDFLAGKYSSVDDDPGTK